jgi:hypothetical protein
MIGDQMAHDGVGREAGPGPTGPGRPGEGARLASRRVLRFSTALLILLLCDATAPPAASSATVAFETENLPDPGGEDLWRYRYVPSDIELQPGQGLALLFDPDAYGALSGPVASDVSGWSAIAIQPDPLLPDDGSLDLQALVAEPATDGTFQIDFVWKGPGTPGTQPFVVYDEQLEPFEIGQTVPEPGAVLAAGTALAVLAWLRRQRGRRSWMRAALAAGCALGAVWGTPASAAAPVVHEYDTGDYRIEYWQVDSARVTRTVTDFRFAARIISETTGGVPRVVAFAASAVPASLIEDDLVVFGDVGPGQTVDSVDTFTLRQDRTVPFDPSDLSFTVEIDSDYPCAPISMATATGVIGEKIPIFGLQEVDGDTGILAVGPVTSIFIPVAQEPDGSYFLTAPIHPDLGGEAGTVAIVLETAGEACPLGDLALPALPAADANEADEILELTEQVANAMLVRFGFEPESFDPAAPNHSATELSLALLWRALLYQDSPTSIATQRASLAALGESERILIGRILAATEVRGLLEEMLLRYEDLAPPPPAPATASAPPPTATTASDATDGSGAGISPQGCLTLNVEKYSILTAGELSRAMQNAQSAGQSFESESTRRKVAAALFGSAALAGPAGLVVSDVTGSILLAQSTGDENPAKLLPSRILSTRIEATVNPINEDFLHGGMQPRPRWRAFTTAQSEGLDLRINVGLLVFQAASGAPLTASNAVPLESFDVATEFVYQDDPPDEGCFRVPPHTWTDINVTEMQWLEGAPTLSGASVALVNTNEIDPVDIGITNAEVQLSSSQFPCNGCTLGDISADIDIEVVEKEIDFSMAQFPISSSSGMVDVRGAIRNSSFPQLYDVMVSAGGVIVSQSPPDPQFSFPVQGLGNDEDFPLSLTVTSTSLTLPQGSPNRMASAPIVLDPMIVVTVLDEDCIEPGRVVPLDAQVTGLSDPSVTWDQPPGAIVTQINETQAEFSTFQAGSYTVTATSVADPMVTGSIDLVVGNCDVELFLYLLGYGYVDTGEQANPPCGTGIDPEPIEEQVELGIRPGGTELRTGVNWTGGGQFPLEIMLDEVANATLQPQDTCHSTSILTQANVTGTLEGQSIGSQQELEIDLGIGAAGGCTRFEPGLTACYSGIAFLDVIASFVFEHDGEAAQAYEYVANVVCSLTKPDFLPPQNVSIVIGLVDADGLSRTPSEVMDQTSLLALVRATDGMCYAGEPVSKQETFVFNKLLDGADPDAPGTPYTGAIMVVLDLNPVLEFSFPESGTFSDSGTMDGFVTIRPTQVPAD